MTEIKSLITKKINCYTFTRGFGRIGTCFGLRYGHMVFSAKRAVKFIGTIRGSKRCRGQFTSCTGYMKRVFRPEEDKEYTYELKTVLTKGNLSVVILDSKKQKLMELNDEVQSATVRHQTGLQIYGLTARRQEIDKISGGKHVQRIGKKK